MYPVCQNYLLHHEIFNVTNTPKIIVFKQHNKVEHPDLTTSLGGNLGFVVGVVCSFVLSFDVGSVLLLVAFIVEVDFLVVVGVVGVVVEGKVVGISGKKSENVSPKSTGLFNTGEALGEGGSTFLL